MSRMPRLTLVLGLLLFVAPPAISQTDSGSLTLERIFASNEFAPERFGPARWLDGSSYTTVEPSATLEGGDDIVRYDAPTGARDVLVPAESLVPEGADEPLEIHGYEWSADHRKLLLYTNSQRVWRDNTRGDYWVLDRDAGTLVQLGGDAEPSTLMFAKFSPDANRVGYVREHDIYVEDLPSGEIRRLTTDGSRTTINGTFDWVYEEELDLQDGWRWSPDGRRIAYWQLDATGVRDFLLINNTDSLYSFTVPIQYPKAGETNSAARVGVVPTTGGETRWLNVPGDPRNNYIARMEWAESPDEIVIQHLNRLQNTLQIMLGDMASGAVRTIRTERDSTAWVDMRVNALEWFPDGESFVWITEADGWRQAVVVSRDGEELRALTPEGVDIVTIAGVDFESATLFYTASPDNALERVLFRVPLDGSGHPERVTPAAANGFHEYQIAPGGGWAIHDASSFGTPPVVDLVRLPDHVPVRTLVENRALKSRVEGLAREPHEFFQVDADGVTLDGWMMKPPGFDPGLRYPVVFYVYGEPWSQTVRDRWDGNRYLWHLLLTQRGYIVVSLDPRGTPAPRGTAWRKAIYQRIGTLTARDLATGARRVLGWPYVDATRTAIWGWSGGGSQSLNAIFRYPDVFGTAMAVAPVPDIRLYDTIYQERYMGLPQESPEAYAESSPLTHAEGLEGNLLLIHGTGDDNVHYQGTERLINALVEANKPFDVMVYPNRTHGISEGVNTTLHLYSLLLRYLEDHVPAGSTPGETAAR